MHQRPGTNRCTAALRRADLPDHRLAVECGNVCTPTLALLLSLVNSPLMVTKLAHTTMHSLLVLPMLVTQKLTAMVQTVKSPMQSVVLQMLTSANITTSHSGEPLRGRAFRSNLRFAPISTAIPLASARSRSLRAPLAGKAHRAVANPRAP